MADKAEKHPYTSGRGGLVKAITQLRRSFPAEVTAETLKKLAIAPNNETYIINILRFINVIDENGKRVPEAHSVFTKHDDTEFNTGFAKLVKKAYAELFSLYDDEAWALPQDKLIGFFRGADNTSSIVGQRQAMTFQILAGFSGHAETRPASQPAATRREEKRTTPKAKTPRPAAPQVVLAGAAGRGEGKNVGLSVRVEINLPVAPDQATYDRIFKSIRENLLRGE